MQTQNGQMWQNELEVQTQYGRSQMANEGIGVSNRPFGPAGTPCRQYRVPNGGRQFGADRFQQQMNSDFPQPQSPRFSGHMAFLKSLQQSNATIRLVTIHDEVVIGQIKNCDDSTISVRVNCATEANPDAYQNRVFFKQNLVEFAPVVEGVTFS